MKKRTKIIILTLMIVLLGVTGYLNIVLNNSITEPTTTTTTSTFVTYRNDRETSRDRQMLYLDAIINNENSTEEAKKKAEEEKLSLIAKMEDELNVEGIIKNLGFNDCIISIGEKINVVVDGELTAQEVAQIKVNVMEQLSVPATKIVVIPSI